MEYADLTNGKKIPRIGLGTWQIREYDVMKKIIAKAYEEGYRLIDTAAAYSNDVICCEL